MARISKSEKVPSAMQDTFNAIVALTDAFCIAHLDEEYRQLARQATATLCRQRPSPLLGGKVPSWACGIVYALGTVNFLFDKSHTPFMSAADLSAAFGLSASTGNARGKAVRSALNISLMDPQWSLPSKLDSNPMAWMISVDGLIMDARHLPREIQEVAFEKGLIPYIPADRTDKG